MNKLPKGSRLNKFVSVHKWLFFAISTSIGGIACATYTCTPPRSSLMSLNLQEIAQFWIGNYSVPLMKTWIDNLSLFWALIRPPGKVCKRRDIKIFRVFAMIPDGMNRRPNVKLFLSEHLVY